MTQSELEHALRTLPQTGTLIKRRPYREVWRFEVDGKGRYLKFYPHRGGKLKRFLRGDPAMREFVRLQWLQKAGIPAPRAAAVLKGFRIDDRTGDAVVIEGIEPAMSLDDVFDKAAMLGQTVPHRYHIAQQVIDIVRTLAKAGLGHADLHLGNFLLRDDGKVFLVDAYEVTRGGVRLKDLLLLGHSAARYATRGELVRGWRELAPANAAMPPRNAVSFKLWRKMAARSAGDNAYFTPLSAAGWQGHGYQRAKFHFPWSSLSRTEFTRDDLEQLWTDLSHRIARGDVDYIKQSDSGDVLRADVDVAGRPLSLVVKIPRRKQWHRYLTDPLRGDRATRAWTRAWELIARDIPTAWPLMVMRRRAAGYTLESAVVFERVDGLPLAHVPLDAMTADQRDTLFRRVGRLLRRIDDTGYYHRDSKSDNVMVDRANRPLLVDLDGIRSLTFGRWSLPRMLKSMKLHKQYTPADSMSLCRGYAPFARVEAERGDDQTRE